MFALFTEFLIKLSPLYFWVIAGFVLASFLKVKKDEIATILVFFVLPFITFHGGFTTPLTIQALSLPVLFFALCSVITLVFLWLGKKIWPDNSANLLAFGAAYGNYGYFALPAAIVLFGKEAESPVIMAGIGYIIYSCTVGYFITAIGKHSLKESLKKTLALPSVYAMAAGLLLNVLNVKPGLIGTIHFGIIYDTMARDMRGVYAIMGMMLIGIAIAEVKTVHFDWKFISLISVAHFLVWPLVIAAFIMIDQNVFHFYPPLLLKIMFLLSVIPVGANLVAYASQLGVQPEKAAVSVLATTLVALFYVPLMISGFAKYF